MKISLIGDSIRMQYEGRVKELLGDNYEFFSPDENCRFSKYTLRGMFDWAEGMKGSRIVHWNNGLWDISDLFHDGKLFTPIEEYIDNMLRIADILLDRCDKVIFATITPVTLRNPYNKNSDIERYNVTLVSELKKKGIIINDLYSAVASDIDKYVSDDNIHLSEEGIELCAGMVADTILSASEGLSERYVTDDCEAVKGESGAPVIL